jgi:hypothetical protein
MSEIIQLTDTARLRVEVDDTSPECPRNDAHMLTGFVKINDLGDSRLMDVPAVHEPPIPIEEAHDRYDETAWKFELSGMDSRRENRVYRKTFDPEVRVERWARAFHGLRIVFDAEHGGYWFVAGADEATRQTPINAASRALFYDNWPELVPGTPEHIDKQLEVIAQEQETSRQWAEGEVYGVILDRLVEWVRPDTGASREEWDEVESIWGCYLDKDYTAEVVAGEYFDLTDEEEAAIKEQTHA